MGPGVLSPLLADAGLERVEGGLRLAGVRLAEVAAAVGTPAYVYALPVLRERYGVLARALAGLDARICFSVKCNGNLAVLRCLRDLGAGADIVSGGELARALAAGFDARHVVFSGVGKSAAELRAAVEAGVGHVNVESLEELAVLADVADAAGRPCGVGVRINPDVQAETHPYISTGKRGDKFGIPVEQAAEAAAFIAGRPRLALTALAMHIGSQIVDVEPFRRAIERLVALAATLRAGPAPWLASVDLGGGLGVRYRDEDRPLDVEAWAAAVRGAVAGHGFAVLLEPGRFIAGPAGVLLARVEYTKRSGGKRYVIVDAGTNDLVRPSYYQAWHEIVEVQAAGRPVATCDVVGPVCESGDFLARGRALPGLARGDLVAVLGAGAYGFTMGSNYNSRPRPPEVAVDEGRWWVARPREAVAELFRTERATADS